SYRRNSLCHDLLPSAWPQTIALPSQFQAFSLQLRNLPRLGAKLQSHDFSKDEGAVVAAEILHRLDTRKTVFAHDPGDLIHLVVSDFVSHQAVFPKMIARSGSDGPIGIKPIVSAIQRQDRVVKPNILVQRSDHGADDIGRV